MWKRDPKNEESVFWLLLCVGYTWVGHQRCQNRKLEKDLKLPQVKNRRPLRRTIGPPIKQYLNFLKIETTKVGNGPSIDRRVNLKVRRFIDRPYCDWFKSYSMIDLKVILSVRWKKWTMVRRLISRPFCTSIIYK